MNPIAHSAMNFLWIFILVSACAFVFRLVLGLDTIIHLQREILAALKPSRKTQVAQQPRPLQDLEQTDR